MAKKKESGTKFSKTFFEASLEASSEASLEASCEASSFFGLICDLLFYFFCCFRRNSRVFRIIYVPFGQFGDNCGLYGTCGNSEHVHQRRNK
jgi:hypothetical protein